MAEVDDDGYITGTVGEPVARPGLDPEPEGRRERMRRRRLSDLEQPEDDDEDDDWEDEDVEEEDDAEDEIRLRNAKAELTARKERTKRAALHPLIDAVTDYFIGFLDGVDTVLNKIDQSDDNKKKKKRRRRRKE